MFARILVPTDLTNFTDAAMGHALLFQRVLGSEIILMHAEQLSWLAAKHPIGYYFDNVPETRVEVSTRLKEFARRYELHDTHIATRFVDDHTARAILAVADEMDADLIVMGTHARHGLKRAVLGSVTERVLHETTRPVMTVRPGAVPAPQMRSVLCPVDRRIAPDAALEKAALLSHVFGAQLIVVNAANNPHIAETAETIGASLIVVGTGLAAPHIVREATRPVLTVVRKPAAEKREAA